MSDERPPSSSPGAPTELQQLEAALAAGVITPELFATLSAQLRAKATASGPPAPPAPKPVPFSPSGNDAELPSLLDMFNQPPAAPASPPVVPPAARPAPASPAPASTADAAARRLIEERLAQIRQRPAAVPAPPTPAPPPASYPAPPAPAFYPEPPAPTFYPTPPVAEVASPPPSRPSAPPAEPASGGLGRWVWVVLLALAVVGGLAYFFTQSSHPDESLASPSLPAAEPTTTEVAAPKPAKKLKKSAKKKRKNKKSVSVAAAAPSSAAPEEEAEEEATATQPEPVAAAPVRAAPATSRPVAAAPEAGDDAATTKVREALASYYADLHAPPLHASQHFAPQVERLYIQQNLTPAAIDAELARSFFPENQQAVAQIEPGTLRVSAPAADGTRTATFTETMRLYRVSKQQFQRLRTNVRVRFNADYQITYMRQEKLLANTFEQ